MLAKVRSMDAFCPSYYRSYKLAERDFIAWWRTARHEDMLALIGDVWETSHRAGVITSQKPAKPTTYDELSEYLSNALRSDVEYMVMLVLWRRHARGRRYVSPFDTAAS